MFTGPDAGEYLYDPETRNHCIHWNFNLTYTILTNHLQLMELCQEDADLHRDLTEPFKVLIKRNKQ